MKYFIQILFLLVVLSITSNKAPANPLPAYEGRGLYVSYCQLCHGIRGKGDGPLAKAMKINPADLTTTVRARSDTILLRIITGRDRQTITGRNRHNLLSDAMPEWKDIFSESQLVSLIAFLRFLGNTKHDLMGDPKIGLQIYQQYCQVCHGLEGDGDGIMTELIGIIPIDLTNSTETNRINNENMVRRILDGKGKFMPAWRGIISQNDVEALVSYIRLLSH